METVKVFFFFLMNVAHLIRLVVWLNDVEPLSLPLKGTEQKVTGKDANSSIAVMCRQSDVVLP